MVTARALDVVLMLEDVVATSTDEVEFVRLTTSEVVLGAAVVTGAAVDTAAELVLMTTAEEDSTLTDSEEWV